MTEGFFTKPPFYARRVVRERGREDVSFVEWKDRWYEELPGGRFLFIPGVRPTKVKELVGERFQTKRRSGEWIDIDGDLARSNSDLLTWCRQHCNSELASGTFLFSPQDWHRHCEDPLPLPFVPELDHPSETVRRLAAAERSRRLVDQELQTARSRRDELARKATAEGHSRRALADVLGISFGRVQQLVR